MDVEVDGTRVLEKRFTLVASTERDLEMLDCFLGTTLRSAVDLDFEKDLTSSFTRALGSDLVVMLTLGLEARFSTDREGDAFDLLAGKDARRTLMKVLSRHGPET